MTITTLSSRDFARDLANAKKAARSGPVIVTDRGRPTFALLKIEDYYSMAGAKGQSLLALMDAIPCGTNSSFEFDPPKLTGNSLLSADFN